MKFIPSLFWCFFLLVACSKEESAADPTAYFIGTWELRSSSLSSNFGTTITFDKTGKATWQLKYTFPTQQQIVSNWRYDDKTKELTFDVPPGTYRIVEKLPHQFTIVTLGTGSGMIFTKD